MITMAIDENEIYSSSENNLVKRIRKKMESINEKLFKPLNSPDFRTKMSIAHVEGEPNSYLKAGECVSE